MDWSHTGPRRYGQVAEQSTFDPETQEEGPTWNNNLLIQDEPENEIDIERYNDDERQHRPADRPWHGMVGPA